MRTWFSTLSLLAALLVSGCSSTPPPTQTPPLFIQVTGTCHDPQGFRLHATGMTPNTEYQTVASYPDGKPYTYLANGGKGRADAQGNPTQWTWDCLNGVGGQPDPPGIYHLRVIDLTTSRAADTTFTVAY